MCGVAKRMSSNVSRRPSDAARPAHASGRGVQQHLLREHPRQRHADVAPVELQVAALLVEREAARHARRTGHRRARGDAEARERAAARELRRRVRRSLPRELAVGHAAAQRERSARSRRHSSGSGRCSASADSGATSSRSNDARPPVIAPSAPSSNASVNVTGASCSPRRGLNVRPVVASSRWPAVGLPRHAAGHVVEVELRQVAREPDAHVGELDVGDDVRRAAVREVEPDPQRALAGFRGPQERDPFAPLRDVRVVEADVEAPFRLAPVLERRAGNLAAKVERRRDRRRRLARRGRTGIRRACARAGTSRGRARAAARRATRRSTSAARRGRRSAAAAAASP